MINGGEIDFSSQSAPKKFFVCVSLIDGSFVCTIKKGILSGCSVMTFSERKFVKRLQKGSVTFRLLPKLLSSRFFFF